MGMVAMKDGMNMYYKDWGTGQTIVFNHGWRLSADAFENQMFFMVSNPSGKPQKTVELKTLEIN